MWRKAIIELTILLFTIDLPDPEGACEWPPLKWSIRSINTKPQHKDRPINTSGSTCEIWCFNSSTCEWVSSKWGCDVSAVAVSEWRWEAWLWEPCPCKQEKNGRLIYKHDMNQ